MTETPKHPMPAGDNPQDSAETLRIMTLLEDLSDEQAVEWGRGSEAYEALEAARHRLAVLQQFANGQGPYANLTETGMQTLARLAARVAELEAALRAAVAEIETQFRRRFVAPESADLMARCEALVLARKVLEAK